MTVRQLASIVGQIVSMNLGHGSVARLMTRSLYTIINCRNTWNDKVVWTEEAWGEIKFWEKSIESLNGKEMRYKVLEQLDLCTQLLVIQGMGVTQWM